MLVGKLHLGKLSSTQKPASQECFNLHLGCSNNKVLSFCLANIFSSQIFGPTWNWNLEWKLFANHKCYWHFCCHQAKLLQVQILKNILNMNIFKKYENFSFLTFLVTSVFTSLMCIPPLCTSILGTLISPQGTLHCILNLSFV